MRALVVMWVLALLAGGPAFAGEGGGPTGGRWTHLAGRELVDPSGKKIGSVCDAVFDAAGRVRYLIVSEGGLLGVGDRLVPVPLSSVRQSDGRLNTNVPRQRIENQPFFYASDWTWMNFNDNRLEQQVREYYGPPGERSEERP